MGRQDRHVNDMSEKEYWKAMCQQAACRWPSVYSATFFSRRNISIVDQQARCFNLCWGLAQLKSIRPQHHVAIVGGGISGMTCAVALAVWTGCLVSVFEKDSVLLKRFRRAGHRFIHPDLNHRGGGDGYLNYDPSKQTRFPFMNWSGNYAPAFAEELIGKFKHYRSTLNIALYLNSEVGVPSSAGGVVKLAVTSGARKKRMAFDAAVLATGFGEENLTLSPHTNDTSYWLSGNPLSYRPSPLRKRGCERVLVSGNGDSAIIELAHLLIQGFDHENVLHFLPSNSLAPRLSQTYAASVAGLSHRQVDREDGGLLAWFDLMEEMHENNRRIPLHPGRGFNLSRDLYAAGVDGKGKRDFESILLARWRELASYEIKTCLESFKLHKIFRRTVRNAFRRDIEVVVTGRSPTVYSVDQAPLNWFLLRLLTHYGALSYRQTELEAARLVKNSIRCRFKGSSTNESFDRVIARVGPGFAGLACDSTLRSKAPYPSGYAPPSEHFFSWVQDHKDFRTRRLRDAQGRTLPMQDVAYPGSILESRVMLRNADSALWFCNGGRQFSRVAKLYRLLKHSRSVRERAALSARLTEIVLGEMEAKTQADRRRSAVAGP